MGKPLLQDELWAIVEPLLPPHPPRPRGGRKPVDDRACFAGIWGQKTGPSPTDRARAGTKHHVHTDANGVPLAITVTGGNRHDVTQPLPLIDAMPLWGSPGRPLTKPPTVIADRGYDSPPHRRELRRWGIDPVIARRGVGHGSGLGTLRCVVERTVSWPHQARRLRVRHDKRADLHEAFVLLRYDVICWSKLQPFC